MDNTTNVDALLEIVRDVRERLSYIEELGVEFYPAAVLDGESHASPSNEVKPMIRSGTTSQNPALERNAMAADLFIPHPLAEERKDRLTSQHGSLRTTHVSLDLTTPPASLFGETSLQTGRPTDALGESLQDIWSDIGECSRCTLCHERRRVVNSEGNPQARLMFIGEAPGADEDAQGRPFVGRAGQLLSKIMESIGIKRDEVMIGNVNRCRPPKNRPPTPVEATTCRSFLLREIAVIKPDVIVVLGNTAMKNLLGATEGITRLRGRFQDYGGIKVMPTYHPAYLLRDPSKKRETWEDMKMVREYLDSNSSLDAPTP